MGPSDKHQKINNEFVETLDEKLKQNPKQINIGYFFELLTFKNGCVFGNSTLTYM